MRNHKIIMKKEITLEKLENDPAITPDDIFPDNPPKSTKQKELAELLETEPQKSVEDLPAPHGIDKKYEQMMKGREVDMKLYSYKELAEKLKTMPEGYKIPTFIASIDDLVDGGFLGGELIVLSGNTKCGKSSLSAQITYNQAKEGFPSLWFSLEMSWQEMTKKFMEFDKEDTGKDDITDLPLFYPIDNTSLGVKWVDKQIEKAKKENHIAFVVIDHLHFLLPLKDYNSNISFLVGGIVRELKKIAVKHDIPILLICHLRKIDITSSPTLMDLRDSNLVACESDFTFIIWRVRQQIKRGKNSEQEDDEAIYTSENKLSCEANRRTGKTRKVSLCFYKGRFYPYEHLEYYQRMEESSSNLEKSKKRMSDLSHNL